MFKNTIKYLKPSQLFYRIFKYFKKTPHAKTSPFALKQSSKWKKHELYHQNLKDLQTFTFLNESRSLDFPNDWNSKKIPLLWLFNLHYFNYLCSEKSLEKINLALTLKNEWVKDNHYGVGIGWHPYTISIRLINFYKAWLGGVNINKHIQESLSSQAFFLSKNLERDILANHYFTNLKALFYSAIFFEQNDWLDFSIEEITRQINEQVLEDGGNFELSPMYHNLFLVDLLDIYNLSLAFPNSKFEDLNHHLFKTIKKMIIFAESMNFSDEELPFFNDSVNGVAPTLSNIKEYASKLNIYEEPEEQGLRVFEESGFSIAKNKNIKLIFKTGGIKADYQPGHAHADLLSIEACIRNNKIFTNSGISHYAYDDERLFQRSSKAKTNVVIDGMNSIEVWDSFRVGRRTKVFNNEFNYQKEDDSISISASHGGYSKYFQKRILTRSIKINENSILIRDSITGKFDNAYCYFYFHPDIHLDEELDTIIIKGKCFKAFIDIKNLDYSVIDSSYFPEFGKRLPNKCLKIKFKSNVQTTEFKILNIDN